MLTKFVDTDSDFNLEVAAEYGYKLVSMPYSINGKTIYPYEDFTTFDPHSFYDMLRGGVVPTTSAISEEKYTAYFEPEFAAGNDILYIHFSRAMSMTFDAMDKAVAALLQKYPGRKFYEVDTKGITIVSYLMARELGDLLNKGMTAEEAVEWGKKEVDHYVQYFFADDLKFMRHSGRVSGLAATMGGLIGLRPVIHMSTEGKMESIGTVKGRTQVMERLVQYVEQTGLDIKKHRFIIGHTDAPALVGQLSQMLHQRFGEDLQIECVTTNPTAGSHCGPNGVGIAFYARNRWK